MLCYSSETDNTRTMFTGYGADIMTQSSGGSRKFFCTGGGLARHHLGGNNS